MADPRTLLADARLYLCTDARERQGDLASFLDDVLSAGVDIVQLRQKGMEALDELRALELFADAAERHGKLFAVNDRADVALAAQAPILHLGQDDLPVPLARQILGAQVLIGRSSHSADQYDAAASEDGVDYVCAGPLWTTPTKPGRPAAPAGLIEHAAQADATGSVGSRGAERRPWFAIGGIDLDRLDDVLARGARRVVVVRAITAAKDPGEAAAKFARALHDR